MKKVRVNSRYVYEPVMIDVLHPAIPGLLQPGDIVRVVNKYGCPPANTMGHCYVETAHGVFAGLVCTGSLQPIFKVSRGNLVEDRKAMHRG